MRDWLSSDLLIVGVLGLAALVLRWGPELNSITRAAQNNSAVATETSVRPRPTGATDSRPDTPQPHHFRFRPRPSRHFFGRCH